MSIRARRELSNNVSPGSSPKGVPQIRNFPAPVWRVLCFASALVIVADDELSAFIPKTYNIKYRRL